MRPDSSGWNAGGARIRCAHRERRRGCVVRAWAQNPHMTHSYLRHPLRAALLSAAVLASALAAAHHSFAVFFDGQKSISITGVVKEFQFVNPHGLIKLVVANPDGTMDEWRFETNSPSILRRRGWTPESLKVGEKVTIDGWPARDNSHYGRLKQARRANGEPIGRPLDSEG